MGETIGRERLQFNGSIRIEAREERISSNGGALLMREYAEKTGILDWLVDHLVDFRNPDRITHPLRELLLTTLLLRGQGLEDQDDADSFRNDPVLRLSVSTRKGDASLRPAPEEPAVGGGTPDGLCSQPTLSRFVRAMGTDPNRQTLRASIAESAIRKMRAARSHRYRETAVDIDDLPIDVHGEQEKSGYHPYYGRRIFRPLVACVGETGDLLDLRLREGTAHSTHEFKEMVTDLLGRIEGELCMKAWLRLDAGFQGEEQYNFLEARGIHYISRVRNNSVLDEKAKEHLFRPVGRPPEEPRVWCHEIQYQAKDWSRARRLILVVKEPDSGKLPITDYFWVATNWTADEVKGEECLRRYRKRGSAEHHMGELIHALHPRLSSANREKSHYRGEELMVPYRPGEPFAQNEVTLLLAALSYNLMHGVRELAEKATGEGWNLQRLRERALLVAARVLLHSNQVLVTIGTSVSGLWQKLLDRISKLQTPMPSSRRVRNPVDIGPSTAQASLL